MSADDWDTFDEQTAEAAEAMPIETINWEIGGRPFAFSRSQVDQELQEYAPKALARLEANEAARRHHQAQLASVAEVPDGVTLADLLAESEEPMSFRIQDLWPREGRIVLSAARKAGKTTSVGNVVRRLVDGGDLFGRFKVDPVADGARVVLLDFEMSRNMLRAWYRELGIQRAGAVKLWPLRGKASTFDIRNPEVRTSWAKLLSEAACEVLIVDCLAPIFNALGIDDNRNAEVGPVLDALDALIVEAGVPDLLVAHHMGHNGERSRGASRLRDWPEVEWKLVREHDEKDNEVDNGMRYFAAYGRDVDVPEAELSFDPGRRELRLNGGGKTRKQATAERKEQAEVERAWEAACIARDAAEAGRPLNVGKVQQGLKTRSRTERVAATSLAQDHEWIAMRAEGTSKICHVGPEFAAEAQRRSVIQTIRTSPY